jgi:hypothetical protein
MFHRIKKKKTCQPSNPAVGEKIDRKEKNELFCYYFGTLHISLQDNGSLPFLSSQTAQTVGCLFSIKEKEETTVLLAFGEVQ